ncbi:MAG: DUF6504 family protein [Candidatus Zixiibacteriota bacterium]
MKHPREKFISAEIKVLRNPNTGLPESFVWDDRDFVIKHIIAAWPNHGYSAGSPRKKDWRMRRHRNFYQVETLDGDIFEMYHDRGLKPDGGKWILLTITKR